MKSEAFKDIMQILGVVGTTLMGYLAQKKNKALKRQKEVVDKLKDNIYQAKIRQVKEVYDLQRFSNFQQIVHKMFAGTPIDRFAIMFVMNGKVDFNFLTVLFDESMLNPEIGDISPYTRFPIDDAYRSMLRSCERNGFVWRDGPDFGVGVIDDYLVLEKIKCIGWGFVQRVRLDEFNDLLVFASVSSESEIIKPLKKKMIQLTFTGRIKPHLERIINVPDPAVDDDILKDVPGN